MVSILPRTLKISVPQRHKSFLKDLKKNTVKISLQFYSTQIAFPQLLARTNVSHSLEIDSYPLPSASIWDVFSKLNTGLIYHNLQMLQKWKEISLEKLMRTYREVAGPDSTFACLIILASRLPRCQTYYTWFNFYIKLSSILNLPGFKIFLSFLLSCIDLCFCNKHFW